LTELEDAYARIAELEAQLERKNWFTNCTCFQKRKEAKPGNHHRMDCRNYVGPLEHKMSYFRLNPTFGGSDWHCSCGGYFRQGGYAGAGVPDSEVVCPHASQDWRGPREEDFS